jgi:hypothetical protein
MAILKRPITSPFFQAWVLNELFARWRKGLLAQRVQVAAQLSDTLASSANSPGPCLSSHLLPHSGTMMSQSLLDGRTCPASHAASSCGAISCPCLDGQKKSADHLLDAMQRNLDKERALISVVAEVLLSGIMTELQVQY